MLLLTMVCKARLGRGISLLLRKRSRTARRLSDQPRHGQADDGSVGPLPGVVLCVDTLPSSKRAGDWLCPNALLRLRLRRLGM